MFWLPTYLHIDLTLLSLCLSRSICLFKDQQRIIIFKPTPTYNRTLTSIFKTWMPANMSTANVTIDAYAILGVERDAKLSDINIAYKRLALKLHPDKAGDSPATIDRFRKVRLQYQDYGVAEHHWQAIPNRFKMLLRFSVTKTVGACLTRPWTWKRRSRDI